MRSLLGIGLTTMAGAALAAPVQRGSDDSGTIYQGAIADLDWGRPLAAGDLDGDGYDETIVGACEPFGGLISRVYVVRGGADAAERGVVNLALGGIDQVILGAAVDDNLGASIAAGDVNGDGIDDLLLCASNGSVGGRSNAGIAYLIYGGLTFFANATRDLSQPGTWDVRFVGPVAAGDMGGSNAFGGLDTHAAAIGRLNNDAFGDVVLGVHLATGGATESGRVYVKFGAAFASGTTFDFAVAAGYNVRIFGDDQFDELGDYVLTGDLTGDGLDELIIPNQYFSQLLFDSEGAVHVYRGRATWPTQLSLATAPADLTLLGNRKYDSLGEAAAVGDFNGDGILDLMAAAPGADAGTFTDQIGDGFVYGLLGSAAYQTGTHLIDYATATPNFLLIGEPQEELGAEVAVGDFNGDGYADLAASERFGGPAINGVVEVLLGRPIVGSPTFTANVSTDLRITGNAQDRIGFSLAVSDCDDDGRAEILFGTPFNNGSPSSGTAYLASIREGDGDLDDDVDLADHGLMADCLAGPVLPAGYSCLAFDLDTDGDVDLADAAVFQRLIDIAVP